jgi:hypothetical protein
VLHFPFSLLRLKPPLTVRVMISESSDYKCEDLLENWILSSSKLVPVESLSYETTRCSGSVVSWSQICHDSHAFSLDLPLSDDRQLALSTARKSCICVSLGDQGVTSSSQSISLGQSILIWTLTTCTTFPCWCQESEQLWSPQECVSFSSIPNPPQTGMISIINFWWLVPRQDTIFIHHQQLKYAIQLL